MKLYTVKLNAWASPVWVQADTREAATTLALAAHPKCDCCGAATKVEKVELSESKIAPAYTRVIMQIKK